MEYAKRSDDPNDALADDLAQETRMNGFRTPMEFFDFNRLSRPADFSTAVSVSLARVTFAPIRTGGAGVFLVSLMVFPAAPYCSAYHTTPDTFQVSRHHPCKPGWPTICLPAHRLGNYSLIILILAVYAMYV